MYLRTTKRRNADGSEVVYYQLAHNVRHPKTGRPVAQVVHNFGRADAHNRVQLTRLCRSIARVCGLEVRDASGAGDASACSDGVLAPDIVQGFTRTLGVVWALDGLWEELGIGPTLRKLLTEEGKPNRYERALLAMTGNRLCLPESKLGVWERWLDTVYLPSCGELKLDDMYEAMDFLHAHAAQVEEAVFFRTADLLNLEVDIIFYDTTTVSFSIDDADDDQEDGTVGLRQLGHSKEGTWTPQIVLALAVTRNGIPVRSWVLPGNTADVTTVEKVRADLRGWKLGRALFVADSGMNSTDNREELARACGRYVLATRVGAVAEVHEEVLGRAGRYKKLAENLRAKEVVVGDGERRRRYILCHNPKQAERQGHHRKQVLKELEAKLAEHPNRNANAKWAVKLRASGRYGRYLAVTRAQKLRVDHTAARSAARLDGKWVLITNDDTLSLEDVAAAYKGQLVIERCFRSLKRTQIRMQPMYHWLPRRIEAHVKICVLALLLERVAESRTGRPWTGLRADLARLQATEFLSPTHRVFQTNELLPEAKVALDSLGVAPPKRVLSIESLPDDV